MSGPRDIGLSCTVLAAALPAIALAALLVGTPTSETRAQFTCAEPAQLRFTPTSKIVRSETGFTQGLEFRNGQLYESTGKIGGTTRLNVISPTGQVTRLTDRGTAVFGEGLTVLNDEVFQLTWQENQVFVYDLAGKQKREMRNPREGWGLTNDGTDLIFSDGGPSIYYADPQTFAIRKSVKIKTSRPGDVLGLNELERVDGKLYGNIFTTWLIVRLEPATGCIDAVADLRSLRELMTPDERRQIETSNEKVLNGIAHDPGTGLFYITGKLWQTIFVGRFGDGAR